MRTGRSAPEALTALVAGDSGRDVRQVGMVDAKGGVATHTGKLCIPAAGGQSGKDYVVQANLMDKATVWPAMAKAFEAASGDLAERMLAALDAAQAEGGDIRGKQSAALIVVKGTSTGRPWADRTFDLRVDDHPEPLEELARLEGVSRERWVHFRKFLPKRGDPVGITDREVINGEIEKALAQEAGEP